MAVTRTAQDERGSHQHTFRRVRMPPNFFAIAFGLAGLAEAWQGAVPVLGVPEVVPRALAGALAPVAFTAARVLVIVFLAATTVLGGWCTCGGWRRPRSASARSAGSCSARPS